MSQAAKIYQFLAECDNPGARALSLALGRAESPYDLAILETILDRSQSQATLELIENYHLYNSARQKIMIDRVDDLFGGLNRAYRHSNIQTRLNSLTIVQQSGDIRLAHVAAELLPDSVGSVAQKAGEVLLDLARRQAADRGRIAELEAGDDRRGGPLEQVRRRRRFLAVLRGGVMHYRIHRRPEALLAAMLLVGADAENFWQDTLDASHSVGKAVASLMMNHSQPELAPFMITALKHPSLRLASARAIIATTRTDWLLAMSREFAAMCDDAIRLGVRLVRQPRWLNHPQLTPERLTAQQQYDLIHLIVQTSLSDEAKAMYLTATVARGNQNVAAYALDAAAGLGVVCRDAVYAAAAGSAHSSAAERAIKKLIEMKSPRIREVMARQLNSTHEPVRELARRYYRQIAFERYWNRFDDMAPPQRIAAGRAIFKIDPDAQHHWLRYAHDVWPINRLRAIQMARALGQMDQSLSEIMSLTKDSDHVVRSCAVAALGRLKPVSGETARRLCQALGDADHRVRANAVESLESSPSPDHHAMIASLADDANNRVRANAVKALLKWKVESAERAIKQMLADPRASHRRSACWAIKAVAAENGRDIQTVQESQHNAVFAVV